MIDHYDWAGGREAMLRFGPDTGPVVVAALPLFDEANRTRAFVVAILRLLAARGIAGALPDLPGQGESLVPTSKSSILKMQDAFNFACDRFDREGRSCYALGLRSGALLDGLAALAGRWHLAPQEGAQLLRELTRIKQAELRGGALDENWYLGGHLPSDAEAPPVEIAGTSIAPDLLADLRHRAPFHEAGVPRRVVRLENDPKPADRKIEAAPLWRRAEPDNDPALAALLADDIAAWIRTCES